MRLTERINTAIKAAMKAKSTEELAALRDIKSKLLLEATSGKGDLSAAAEHSVVMKLYKQRMDTYDLYIKEGREDLAKEEKLQAEVISAYLPEMASAEEIEQVVTATIRSVGAKNMQDMGKVMPQVLEKLSGRADGKVISTAVKAQLGGS